MAIESPPISPFQLQISQELANGLVPKEIALKYHRSIETIKSHTKHARSKTNTHTTIQLVVLCLRKGWIE